VESWIKIVQGGAERGQVYAFAVTDKANHRLMGTVSIRVDATHNRGEIAYWIGKQFWGHGYATEATGSVFRQPCIVKCHEKSPNETGRAFQRAFD